MEFIRNEFLSRYRLNVHARKLREVDAEFGVAGAEFQAFQLVESRRVASEANSLMTERSLHITAGGSGVESDVHSGRTL